MDELIPKKGPRPKSIEGLTDKQLLWIDYYLQTFNKTEAARRAGYKGDTSSLSWIGNANYKNPVIKRIIDLRLRQASMESEEVLMRISSLARLDITEYMTTITNNLGQERQVLDIEKLKQAGLGYAIKNIRYNRDGTPQAELYDSSWALGMMVKLSGLYDERTTTNLNIDPTKLSDEQIQSILSGADPLSVLRNQTEEETFDTTEFE